MKKKICVVVASRANYGRAKFLMRAIQEREELELQVIVGASTLLQRFGTVSKIIEEDGFHLNRSIYYVVEGENLLTQAKSTGLGIIELASAFHDLKPDMVVSIADRFETLATAVAASYLNICLVHLQGGEISGNIDDRVRHAITKLSDIHFVSTNLSKERVIGMGENPDFVFNYGCPSIDVLRNSDLSIQMLKNVKFTGTGRELDFSKPYLLMLQHPVTTSYGSGYREISQTLLALRKFKDYQKIVLWPNIDAGSDDVSKGIREFKESNLDEKFFFQKNFSPEEYAVVLNNAKCCIGNSSSFIREGSYLGVPAVIVGDRQVGREQGENVVLSDYDEGEIEVRVKQQIDKGRYQSSDLFGNGDAGIKIANWLAKAELKDIVKSQLP